MLSLSKHTREHLPDRTHHGRPPPPRHPDRRPRLCAAAQPDAGGGRLGPRHRVACRDVAHRGDRGVRQGVQRQPDHRHRLGGAAGDRPARALRPPAARRRGDPRLQGRDHRAVAAAVPRLSPADCCRGPAFDRRPRPDRAAPRGPHGAGRSGRSDTRRGRKDQGDGRGDRQCRAVLRRGHLLRDRLDRADPAGAGRRRL